MPNELKQLQDLLQRMERVTRVTMQTTDGPWWIEEDGQTWRLHGGGVRQILKAPKNGTPYAEYWPNGPDGAHMVRWNPLVVLEMIQVFQRIIDEHMPIKAVDGKFYCQRCEPESSFYPCLTVKLIQDFWMGVER